MKLEYTKPEADILVCLTEDILTLSFGEEGKDLELEF